MSRDVAATSDLNTRAGSAGSTLNRDQVLEILRSQGEELRRLGVSSLHLFGSMARDEASPKDVDLLVDFSIPPTFRGFMRLRFFLEDLLAIKVDLVTKNGLRDRVRPFVEKDAIRVA